MPLIVGTPSHHPPDPGGSTPTTPSIPRTPPTPRAQTPDPGSGVHCGCLERRRRRVVPEAFHGEEFNRIEIRPKRWLRVRHINPRARDKDFEKEYENFIECQRLGRPYIPKGSPSAHSIKNGSVPQYEANGKWRKASHKKSSEEQVSSRHKKKEQRICIEDGANYQNYSGEDPIVTVVTSNGNQVVSPNSRVATASSVEFTVNNIPGSVSDDSAIQKVIEHNHILTSHTSVRKLKMYDEGVVGKIHQPTLVESHQDKISHLDNSPGVPTLSTQSSTSRETTPRVTRVGNKGEVTTHGAVLFFIHGVGGSSDIWQAQLDYFGDEGYEIIAPDMLGHGFSGAPDNAKDYTFQELQQDMLALFDKFCKKHNVLIGHSYGTSFATALAKKRSRWTSKLILINGGGPTPLAPQPGVFQWPTWILTCIKPVLVCGFHKSAFHKESRKTYIPKSKAFDIPTYILKHMMNGQVWPEGNAEFHQWLSIPTLLIFGQDDQLVTLEEEIEMNMVIYGSKLEVIENASHMVMMEKPEEVSQLIYDFLLQGRAIIQSKVGSEVRSEVRPPSRDVNLTRARTLSASSVKSFPGHLLHASLV